MLCSVMLFVQDITCNIIYIYNMCFYRMTCYVLPLKHVQNYQDLAKNKGPTKTFGISKATSLYAWICFFW